MVVSVRSYLIAGIAGIAVIGAGVIAAGPTAPPPPTAVPDSTLAAVLVPSRPDGPANPGHHRWPRRAHHRWPRRAHHQSPGLNRSRRRRPGRAYSSAFSPGPPISVSTTSATSTPASPTTAFFNTGNYTIGVANIGLKNSADPPATVQTESPTQATDDVRPDASARRSSVTATGQ